MESKYKDKAEFHHKEWNLALESNKQIAAEHHKLLHLKYTKLLNELIEERE